MRFQTILVDPPWPSPAKSAYSRDKDSDWPYPTMMAAELADLPLSFLSERGTHLWLWTTQTHLPLAMSLIPAWGFTYQVCIPAIKPHGFGNWWAKTSQFLLFAYRSPLSMARKGHPTHIFYKPTNHSSKPEESYALIEAVSHPPRVELFARKTRDGWACLGRDVTGNDVLRDIALIGGDR